MNLVVDLMTKSMNGCNKDYYDEEVIYITNMIQNLQYLSSGFAPKILMDIIPCETKTNKIAFVWKKSPELNELYTKWLQNSPKQKERNE